MPKGSANHCVESRWIKGWNGCCWHDHLDVVKHTTEEYCHRERKPYPAVWQKCCRCTNERVIKKTVDDLGASRLPTDL